MRSANQDTTRCWMTSAETSAASGARPLKADANHETLIRDPLDDQYSHPRRIVAFNTTEGWSRDVSVDMADELRRRFCRVR